MFNESEQKLLLGSFIGYLEHDTENDFIIDIDTVWKWLGFGRKNEAKRLLEKHFLINCDYIIHKGLTAAAVVPRGNVLEGLGGEGILKEKILMTIDTFKKLCLKANTKKADEIHTYYVKLEKMFLQTINEESIELRLQLQQQEHQLKIKDQGIEKLIKEKPLERHNILLREFGNIGSIVYIVKVKCNLDNSYIVRLGESRRGIKERYNEHKQNYGGALILDCFIVKKSKDFESFLHNYNDIKSNKVTNLDGHENEKELFLIGKNLSYQQLLNIINQNIKYYNDDFQDLEKLKLENKQLEIMQNFNKSDLQDFVKIILDNNTKLLNEIVELKKIVNEIKIQTITTKTVTNFNEPLVTLGPRVQQINPETLQLIKVYESTTVCMKENMNVKRSSLNKAVAENTIYQGFRWLFVDRTLDQNVICDIKHTKETRIQNIGYIAKLNSDKSEILNIYLNRKTAAKLNEYKSDSSLDNVVKKCSLSNGNYYILYNDVSKELRDKYKIPILYKNGIGKFDINNNLIKEFICKEECRVKENISNRTLLKALDTGILYNNVYYKYIKDKVEC